MPSAPQPAADPVDEPLPLIGREDLETERVTLRGESTWIVKDPVSLEYFRLTDQQLTVLRLLDGERTPGGLRDELAKASPDCAATPAELRRLAFDLYAKGLAYSTRPGEGETFGERIRRRRRRVAARAAQSLLYIRLPGFDPTAIVERLYPATRWVFHPAVVASSLGLTAAVWLWLILRYEQLATRLPDAAEFASPRMLLGLWLTMGAAKVLHEFGHALACRHLGGRCTEIGVALLVFSPCLYCDVSDIARLPRRVDRLAVGAAGMYVEVVLSALAALVWLHAEPGAVRDGALCLFLVTNVSTIVFNLNPLLRLDGYFMLADLLETPNLRARAGAVLNQSLSQNLLGVTSAIPFDEPAGRRRWLTVYAVASGAYRWFFLIVVTASLYAMLQPYALGSLGLMIGGATVVTGLLTTATKSWRFAVKHRGTLHGSLRARATAVTGVAATAAFFFAPLPLSVEAPCEIRPAAIRHLYAPTEARLAAIHVAPGDRVEAGELLIRLEAPEARERYVELQTAHRLQDVDAAVHRALGEGDEEASALKAKQALYARGAERLRQLERLGFRAPVSGTVVAPDHRPAAPRDGRDIRLAQWSGDPLDRANLGARVQRGTHLMSVAESGAWEAVLRIDGSTREDFNDGAEVRVKLDGRPDASLRGVIRDVARWSDPAESGVDPPASATEFQAIVALDAADASLVTGATGRARTTVTRRSAAGWIWRQAWLTFRPPM